MAAKLGQGRGAKPKPRPAGEGGDAGARALTSDDNRRAIFEAEEAQALSFVGKLQAIDAKITQAMIPVDALKDEKALVVGQAKLAGFPAKLLKEIQADLNVRGVRKDLTEAEKQRVRIRRYFGLPVGETDELEDALPAEEKDKFAWEAEGYRAGIRADEPKPPGECPTRFHQNWLEGYHAGQAKNIWALKKAAEPQPAPDAPPKAAPDPEPSIADQRLAEQRQINAVKEGLETIKAPETVPGDPGDDFQAPDDELAGQTTRQVVKAQAEEAV